MIDATPRGAPPAEARSAFMEATGRTLALSYPLLAFSTGGRSIYQLFFKQGGLLFTGTQDEWLGPLLSFSACLVYLVATVGFTVRRRWAWWVSLGALSLETVAVLVVGFLSQLPGPAEHIGATAWGHFGRDYGYFPLFQPLLGLAWLLWPANRASYAIGSGGRTPDQGPAAP